MNNVTTTGHEGALSAVLRAVRSDLEHRSGDETARELFLLGLMEALNNAAEHGNANDASRKINVRWHFTSAACLMQVADRGQGFTPVSVKLEEVPGPRGRGVALMRKNSDMVIYNPTGNTVTLIKGGSPVNTALMHAQAELRTLDGGIFIASNFRPREEKPFSAVAELFDLFNSEGSRYMFADLQHVRLLSSTAWGTIFAEASREDVEAIVLFNAGPALVATAKQMGLEKRTDYCRKISVLPDSKAAFEKLAEILPS